MTETLSQISRRRDFAMLRHFVWLSVLSKVHSLSSFPLSLAASLTMGNDLSRLIDRLHSVPDKDRLDELRQLLLVDEDVSKKE